MSNRPLRHAAAAFSFEPGPYCSHCYDSSGQDHEGRGRCDVCTEIDADDCGSYVRQHGQPCDDCGEHLVTGAYIVGGSRGSARCLTCAACALCELVGVGDSDAVHELAKAALIDCANDDSARAA